MNEIAVAEKTMSITELARSLNVSRQSIMRVIKKGNILSSTVQVKNGIAANLTEEQCTKIKMELEGHHNVADKSIIKSVSNDMEFFAKTIELQRYAVARMKELELTNTNLRNDNEHLQIQLDEAKDWYSVKRVQMLGYLEDKDPKEIWRPLKKYCIEHNLQIQKIFDANYGEVSTYPSESWKGVYGIDLKNKR